MWKIFHFLNEVQFYGKNAHNVFVDVFIRADGNEKKRKIDDQK